MENKKSLTDSASLHDVCHRGVVRQVTEKGLLVEVIVESACAACHAKSFCISSEQRQQLIQAKCSHPQEFTVGEQVQLTMRRTMGGKAVRIGYLYPLIFLIVTLLLSYRFLNNELLSVAVTLAVVFLYYLVVGLSRHKLSSKFVIEANKLP